MAWGRSSLGVGGNMGGSVGTGQGMLQGPAGPHKPGSTKLQEGKMLIEFF